MSKKHIIIPSLLITLLFLANCAAPIKPVAAPINPYTEPAEEEVPPI